MYKTIFLMMLIFLAGCSVESTGAVEVPLEISFSNSQNFDIFREIRIPENKSVQIIPEIEDLDLDLVEVKYSLPLDENGFWKTSFGDAGEYLVFIDVNDKVNSVRETIKLVVERVNQAPVIENLGNLTINEGETVSIDPLITDANGDDLYVSISEPLSDKVWETNYLDSGIYNILIEASDGEKVTRERFNLVVNDVNRKPVIGQIDDLVYDEGDLVKLNLDLDDLDTEDQLIFKVSEPIGEDLIWQTNYTDHGEYEIKVEVTDGKVNVTKTFNLLINDVNMPPKLLGINSILE